jgi:hypothetical protein
MNIKSHVIATFSIENIFPPAKESWDSIYVTFSSISEANTVYSYTRNMRKEVNVGIFVPNEWQARFRAMNNIAYGLRYPPSGEAKGMCAVVTPRMSPATGRQGRDTLKRQRPGGSGSDSDNCGVDDRRVKPRPSVSDSAVDHATEAQSQSNLQDPGRVIAEESYCPASPAPVKKNQALSDDPIESPIFKKAKQSTYRMNPFTRPAGPKNSL